MSVELKRSLVITGMVVLVVCLSVGWSAYLGEREKRRNAEFWRQYDRGKTFLNDRAIVIEGEEG